MFKAFHRVSNPTLSISPGKQGTQSGIIPTNCAVAALQNLRESRRKSGNHLLENPSTCYYKYVYIILDQSCCLAWSVRINMYSDYSSCFYLPSQWWPRHDRSCLTVNVGTCWCPGLWQMLCWCLASAKFMCVHVLYVHVTHARMGSHVARILHWSHAHMWMFWIAINKPFEWLFSRMLASHRGGPSGTCQSWDL
jgi:hypothetical protein